MPADKYVDAEPPRSEIDALKGATLLEFGSRWCGHCRRVEPFVSAELSNHAAVRHVKIVDGPGRPLGRSFGVKLWPTLVFLKDGKECARLIRPTAASAVRDAIAQIDPPDPG